MSSEGSSSQAEKPKDHDHNAESDEPPPPPTSILPQSMPSPNAESYPFRHGSTSPYDMGLGHADYERTPMPGHYEYGQEGVMYPQMDSFHMPPYSTGPPPGPMDEPPGRPGTSGILPSSSSAYSGGTAFSVLPPPVEHNAASSPSMSIMPPHGGHSAYTSPVYGYGSSSPGYSGTSLGGGYQDMSPYPPTHHYPGAMSPQLGPYDGSAAGPTGMGSQSASAASGYTGMGPPPMYGSGMGLPQYHGYFPEQYRRPGRGHYDHGRGRGGGRGGGTHVNHPGPDYVRNPKGPRQGPDGANLYIFHVPNDYTNQEMYDLFAPFGTIMSVRIMTDKETGRSRGFGFVSYDSPAAAAAAIQHLNGFPIRGKRLKVQHKQTVRSHSPHYPLDSNMPRPATNRLPPFHAIGPNAPVLPPPTPEQGGGEDDLSQDDPRQVPSHDDRTSPSPLGDLSDMRNSLPDP